MSVALAEAGRRRGVTYANIQAAQPGRENLSRRSFHDDISVIVVFLDRMSFLRTRPLNISYRGSNAESRPSDFANSGLTSLDLKPMSPRRLKETFKRRMKSKSSSPRTPESPLGESSRSRDTDNLINQSPPTPRSRWESLKKRIFPNRRRI